MRGKSLTKDLFSLIPLLISGLLCIALIFLLWQKVNSTPTFTEVLTNLTSIFIGISGFLGAIIMIYMAFQAMNLKNARSNVIDNLGKITQKMHTFRSIVDLLFRSKIWLPGLREYIDDEFAGLTFFEVKEFYKGKSKLAIEFLQENHNYADTENLYLELKSLLLTGPREKSVPDDIVFPKMYNKDIVEKWLEHKCGSGLWYYFGYKYAVFKEALDLNAVFERHQDKIMALANTIDSEHFEDSSFNEVFLSKLGEYMTKEVLPKLYQFQDSSSKKTPALIRYMYMIFLMLALFGVILPLLFMLFSLSILTLIVSFSFVISIIFFVSISFYQFLTREINS
jgi:hypothetical protein